MQAHRQNYPVLHFDSVAGQPDLPASDFFDLLQEKPLVPKCQALLFSDAQKPRDISACLFACIYQTIGVQYCAN